MEGLRQKQKVDSAKKHGQPLMLGEDIDKQLQLYLQKVSNQGGVITASVVAELVAAARGILEFNGHSSRVTHIMPIFPPIMLCSYAQLLPCYSFPAATYYAHFMLTFAVQIPTKNQRMRQFSSLSDLKSMVACKVEVNTVILG